MKHRNRFLVFALAAVMAVGSVWFCGCAEPVRAAKYTAESDGVKAVLTTDKDSYTAEENIRFELNISSQSTVKLRTDVSAGGYAVNFDKNPGKIVANGQPAAETASGYLSPALPDEPGSAEAGGQGEDLPPAAKPYRVIIQILLAAFLIGAIIFIIRRAIRGKKNTVNMLLIGLLLAGLASSGLQVRADNLKEPNSPAAIAAAEETVMKTLELSVTVKVDGQDLQVRAAVQYGFAYTRAELEEQLMSVAWAYHHKFGQMQYDSQSMNTELSKYNEGIWRLTEDVSPEYGSSDTTIYSVCTDYPWKSFLEAFDYRLLNGESSLDFISGNVWMASDLYAPETVLARTATDITGGESLFEDPFNPVKRTTDPSGYGFTSADLISLTELREKYIGENGELLRPGDVLIYGHCMMYVGNGLILHCWGSKYNTDSGIEAFEPGGSILCENVNEYWLTEGETYGLFDSNKDKKYCILVRPMNALLELDDGDDDLANDLTLGNFKPKAATLSRLEYPAMSIDRTLSCGSFGSAEAGGELTVNVRIHNHSNEGYYAQEYPDRAADYVALPVTEQLPEGTELVPGSITCGGTQDGRTISWKLDLKAGEEAVLSYTVKVNKARGEKITSEGGFVADIPSNSITVSLSGKHLSEASAEKLLAFAAVDPDSWRETFNISRLSTDTDYMERIYQAVLGLDVQLPKVNEVLCEFFSFVNESRPSRTQFRFMNSNTGNVLELKDRSTVKAEYLELYDMMVPGFFGGTLFFVPDVIQGAGYNVNEFHFSYFQPGDIMLMIDLKKGLPELDSYEMCMYAGNDTVIVFNSALENTVYSGTDAKLLLWSALSHNLCCMLRPSLVSDDINLQLYDKAKEPVYTEPEPKTDMEVNGYGQYPLSEENKQKFMDLIGIDWAAVKKAGFITNIKGKQIPFGPEWRNTDFTEKIYELVGLECDDVFAGASAMSRLKTMVTTAQEEAPGEYYFDLITRKPKSGDAQILFALLKSYCGGVKLNSGVEDWPDGLSISGLEIGDVISLTFYNGLGNTRHYWTCIYLGKGILLTSVYKIAPEGNSCSWMELDFSDDTDGSRFRELLTYVPDTDVLWEYVEAYRPSLGYYDINRPTWNPALGEPGPGPSVKEGTKELPAAAKAALLQLTADGWKKGNIDFPAEVYEKIGLNISDFTSSASLVTMLKAPDTNGNSRSDAGPFRTVSVDNGKTAFYGINGGEVVYDPILAKMIVPGFCGGPKFMDYYTDYETYSLSDLKPGDILFFMVRSTDAVYHTGVYLGTIDGEAKILISKAATNVTTEYEMLSFADDDDFHEYLKVCPLSVKTGNTNVEWELFFVLRPGQYYDFR